MRLQDSSRLFETVVIGTCISKQALLVTAYTSPRKRSEWERPASERSMMTRYTVISISHRSKDKSYTISRLVIRFTIHESVPNRVLHFTAVRRHYHSVKILTACTVHV